MAGKPYKEQYFEVVFAEKGHQNDTRDVQLTVNGECLVIKRGVTVVVPQRFLECADHTLYPEYEQEPGKDRKITSWVKTYQYNKLREATREEFDRMKKKGDKDTKEAYRLQGDK